MQRAAIEAIVETLEPGVVACLGADVLNDIPYQTLIEGGAKLYLVDWLAGAPDFGIAHSIIEPANGRGARCLYCRLAETDPRSFCLSYREPPAKDVGTCSAFVPSAEAPLTCLAFRRGKRPNIHIQDVTGGYATAFGEGVPAALRDVTSWRQAFRRAIALAGRVRKQAAPLDIPDGSVDLVISSMVLSQFEHEPYEYFAGQVAAELGPPGAEIQRRLRPAMETLRSALLVNQVEGHCAEIERILAPEGRCFVAFEIFHRGRDNAQWRLLETMREVMGMLGRRFAFDFEASPEPILDRAFEGREGRSVVYQSLIARKSH